MNNLLYTLDAIKLWSEHNKFGIIKKKSEILAYQNNIETKEKIMGYTIKSSNKHMGIRPDNNLSLKPTFLNGIN